MSDNAPPPPSDVPPPTTTTPAPAPTYGTPQPGYTPPPAPGGYAPQPAFGPAPGVPRPGELLDRFLARLIDYVVLGVAGFIINIVFAAVFITSIRYDAGRGEFVGGSHVVYWLLTGIVLGALYLGYQALMESNSGQSLGKMALKLKVVGPDGVSNPTFQQAVRRNIFLAFPIAFIVPVIGPLIGGLAALVGEIMIAVGINNDPVKRQAWHDHFAGETQVLKIG